MKNAQNFPNSEKISKRTKAHGKNALRSKGWSLERRLAQAARIRHAQIWLKSTGPISADGKKRSAQNARKPGLRRQESMRILTFLQDQNRFLKMYRQWLSSRGPRMASKATFSATLEVGKYHEKLGFLLGIWGRKLIRSGIKILEENNG